MSRAALEQLEASDLDLAVTLVWLVRASVTIDDDELHAARRRAMFVLAAGGDPHRDLGLDSVAAERLADELDAPARRQELDAALAALDTSGLPRVSAAVQTLRGDPETAWRTLALALLADEIAE
jgi:predicted negative regulator of RcsB-dependent stress response